MSCASIRRLIGVYRELDRAERRMLNAHLQGCENCRLTWETEQDLLRRVRSIPVLDPPAGFESQLLSIPIGAARPRAWLLPRLLPLALLALGGLMSLGGGRAPRESSDLAGAIDRAETSDLGSPIAGLETIDPHAAIRDVKPRRQPPVPRRGLVALRTPMAEGEASAEPSAGRSPESWEAPGSAADSPGSTAGGRGSNFSNGTGESPDGSGTGGSNDPGRDEPGRMGNAKPQENPTPIDKSPIASPLPPGPAPIPSPVALACVELTLEVFADCPDCDGAVPPGFELPLPVEVFYSVYDADGALSEGALMPEGASRIQKRLPSLCGRLPLTVGLQLTDPAWQACPAGGPGLQRELTLAGPHHLEFGLTRGCPAPTAPPIPSPEASPTLPAPSETPEPPAPTAQPTSIAAGATAGPTEPSPAPSETPMPPPTLARPTLEPPAPEPSPDPDPESLARPRT